MVPHGYLDGGLLATARLRRRAGRLRMLRVSDSMVALASAFGKCQWQVLMAFADATDPVVIRMTRAGQNVTGAAATGSPTVRRRELGALLRTLRLEAGMTVDQVAESLLCSPSKVSRLETGQRGASLRDIRDLCNLYGVTDSGQRERLGMLAREGKQQIWWQTGWPYSTYLGLEAEASAISEFESDVLPGLMQTQEYTRALMRAAVPPLEPEEVERHVRARGPRQEVFRRADNPPRFHAVIDEAVFHRGPGDAVMRDQVHRIIEVSRLPHVSLQLLRFGAGMHPASESTFIILDYAAPLVPSTVYVETLTGNLYLERQADVHAYRLVFERLCDMAASPEETDSYLQHMLNAYAQ